MNRIKKLRLEAGLTQKELSELVEVSDASINKYEKGIMNPKIDKLVKMSEIFSASIGYITGESDSRFDTNGQSYSESWDRLAQKMNSYNNSGKYQSVVLNEEQSKKIILENFNKLNLIGRREALKQIENLTKITEYTE